MGGVLRRPSINVKRFHNVFVSAAKFGYLCVFFCLTSVVTYIRSRLLKRSYCQLTSFMPLFILTHKSERLMGYTATLPPHPLGTKNVPLQPALLKDGAHNATTATKP